MRFRIGRLSRLGCIFAGMVVVSTTPLTGQSWQAAADAALRSSPGLQDFRGTAVVLSVVNGSLLAVVHPRTAASLLAEPGSALKPFVLEALLDSGRWPASRLIACSRKLAIGGRQMDCVHPAASTAFDARAALAYSCNRYFAEAAPALSPEELLFALRSDGLASLPGLLDREARGELSIPHSRAEEQLMALGVGGVRVTPLELAESYRGLLLRIRAKPDGASSAVLRAGLLDSVSFGMASGARVAGVAIAGKTGTASTAPGGESHGWFAGYAPAEDPRVVVVVYLPHGRGADAALVAGRIFARSPLGTRP